MNLALAPRMPGEGANDFARDLLNGLRRRPRRLPSKYFYDAAGAALFSRICELPEYYLTRAELSILEAHAAEMAALIGSGATVIEFGAGNPRKARILLSALDRPKAYVPVDVCPMPNSVFRLQREFGVAVHPLLADFMRPLELPAAYGKAGRLVGFFPGSTIGNLGRDGALLFLRMARRLLDGGGLLVGVDLVKNPAILHAAYNDSAGVTAAFNRNMLERANRELGANFDPSAFDHHAPYNVEARRIEMYLVSRIPQRAIVAGREFRFEEGEGIHTEDSHKYTHGRFRMLASEAGFAPRAVWTDAANFFAVYWLDATRSGAGSDPE